ncbi:crotonase/enoyl-CoA hydratase family protein [Simiduia sp. 21SJ11W-1]|uniref:crotonase/enoyl-CoA hydratase family protein n=1 Tax=Simiduia sp. 21SJ11W-1 TaxID=2909669 RepID=UPI0020A1CD20|nr:crotonase/enoyl-CoA hydratase family protein [Simiduia sp. 21SJ11W-1]UTA49154.1 crotonase/enoyl-CoA hydratase family protein [Simiduia sp. 21SJ11W-1]
MHPIETACAGFSAIHMRVEGAVAHLQFARPEALNTMNDAFWREFPAALDAVSASGEVRVLVISSTGKHFTAGMDLAVFADLNGPQYQLEASRRAEMLRRWVLELQQCFNRLEALRVPVLAAIQGGCIGGGVDLVSAVDCRYATSDSYFCIKEIDLAITADLGTLQRLPHLLPQGVVRELAYTGRKFSAQEAQNFGFVNAVYPDHEALLNAVLESARAIAEKSPLAIHGTKEMLNYARDHSVQDSLRYAATWQGGMFHAHEVLEAMTAGMEKRAPEFENLQPNNLKTTR